jgi:hypothetical protein
LTHDIEGLIDIFDKAGIPVPSDFQGAGVLTSYSSRGIFAYFEFFINFSFHFY